MCGMKDSLWSKTMPRNLVSSTTGTGYRLVGGWVLGGICAIYRSVCIRFQREELESIGVSPVCKFVETLLKMTFYNMDMLRSVADQKIVDI